MASSARSSGHCYCFRILALFLLLAAAVSGQLMPEQDFYATSCTTLKTTIETEVSRTLFTDQPPSSGRRMGASLLRLHFHDCFVQGCDGSVLLDDDATKGIVSEKNAGPNVNSLRGFGVIDRIKAQVEKDCPGVVSCSDILALAARQAVINLGGQGWPLLLGRRDSTTANMNQANSDLPSPSSELATLIAAFGKKGFSPSELVALSGAHTIGLAQCANVDQTQRRKCTVSLLPESPQMAAPLDEQTPEGFDNRYYGNLPKRGLLHSDRVLTDRSDLATLVQKYSSNQALFFGDFASAMEKMANMSLLASPNGQIRLDCKRLN